jgi:hypothetical protein
MGAVVMASRRSTLPDSFPKKRGWFDEHYGGNEDEWAAHCFLMGYDEPVSDQPLYVRTFYLKGQHETVGRAALIRVLEGCWKRKNPLPEILISDLLNLLIVDGADRWLILKPRFKNWHRTTKPRAIAYFIQEQMQAGGKWEKAVEAAQKVFGRNGRPTARSTITDAWAADKKQNPELHRQVRSDRRSSRT